MRMPKYNFNNLSYLQSYGIQSKNQQKQISSEVKIFESSGKKLDWCHQGAFLYIVQTVLITSLN